jgi:hypothetical protein
MGEERLAGLALMHMHYNTSVDIDAIIKVSIQINPRRLFSDSIVMQDAFFVRFLSFQ